MLATDDEAVIARYRAFGWALGLAFQLNDDLLGIWGDEQATGKEPSDLAKHKKTLPSCTPSSTARPTTASRLGELYATPTPSPGRGRRGGRDPRADRCPGLHPRPGPPLPRRGAGRARRRRAWSCPRPRAALEAIIVRVISA